VALSHCFNSKALLVIIDLCFKSDAWSKLSFSLLDAPSFYQICEHWYARTGAALGQNAASSLPAEIRGDAYHSVRPACDHWRDRDHGNLRRKSFGLHARNRKMPECVRTNPFYFAVIASRLEAS
jgi:hypothetical protein